MSTGSGTYQVTGLVSWQFANFQTTTPPFIDAIGDPSQRANGNAVLRIAYSDGSEGTLGIVTAAALKLFPKPALVETALIGLRSVEDAMIGRHRALHGGTNSGPSVNRDHPLANPPCRHDHAFRGIQDR